MSTPKQPSARAVEVSNGLLRGYVYYWRPFQGNPGLHSLEQDIALAVESYAAERAEEARAEEREACAKACDEHAKSCSTIARRRTYSERWEYEEEGAQECASAIRARSSNSPTSSKPAQASECPACHGSGESNSYVSGEYHACGRCNGTGSGGAK